MESHYARVEDEIRRLIALDRLGQGDRIPSERELSLRFGASRMTIRRASTHLVDTGVLRRDATRGVVVAGPRVVRDLDVLTSTTSTLEASAMQPSTELREFREIPAAHAVAARLGLLPNDPVLHMQRLRFGNGEPLALERVWVPNALVAGIRREHVEGRSFYAVLGERYGIKLTRAEETIELVLADEEDSSLLETRARAPLFLISSVTYDSRGVAVEYAEQKLRGDRCRLRHACLAGER